MKNWKTTAAGAALIVLGVGRGLATLAGAPPMVATLGSILIAIASGVGLVLAADANPGTGSPS